MEYKMSYDNDKRDINIDREEKQLVEHFVKVSDFIEMKIKIPKVLDSMEFVSILEQARKMLKISEIEVPVLSNNNRSRGYARVSVDDNNAFLKEYENASKSERQKLVSKYNFGSYNSMQSKIYKIRHDMSSGSSVKKKESFSGRHKIYSDDTIASCLVMLKQGVSTDEIYRKHGFVSKKSFYNTMFKRTGKGLSQLRNGAVVSSDKKSKEAIIISDLWTKEKVDKLIQLKKDGTIASEIAKILGMSDRQVYDKVHNMGRAGFRF
jgi:hypothetical protein